MHRSERQQLLQHITKTNTITIISDKIIIIKIEILIQKLEILKI